MLSPSDAELARRDPKIVGLPILFDPEAFVALLQTRLTDVRFERARIEYVRYKPETNCLVLYRLEAAGKIFQVYATAYGRGAADKLKKAHLRPSANSPLGPGRLVFDDEAVMVSFFPNDAKVKTLFKLADADSRKRLLRKLISQNPNMSDATLQSLRYKPERRYVAKLLVENKTQAVLKFYSNNEYQAAKAGARAFQQRETLRLANELGYSDNRRVLAFEWVGGEALSEAYLNTSFKSETMELVGRSLAELHTQQPEGLSRITSAAEGRTLRAVADGIGAISPQLRERAQLLAARLAVSLADEPQRASAIHGDFYANQVIIRKNSAVILDFDRAAYGNPAADLGNFIAHLEDENLHGRLTTDRVECFEQALLRSYRNSLASHHDTAVPVGDRLVKLYTAIGLLRLSPRPFREYESNWSEAIEKILERAEKMLASAENGSVAGNKQERDINQASNVFVADRFDVANDARMPFLSAALDPTEIERLFTQHLLHLGGSEETVSLRAIRLIRYKPQRRAIFKYDLEVIKPDSDGETFTLVGKARAKGLDKTSFYVQRSLWLDGFGDSSTDGFSVPKPIALIPELQMWLQQLVPGKTAFSLLVDSGGVELASQIAEAIYKLHQTKMPEAAASRRPHTITDELDILHQRLAVVAEMKPEWRGRLRRLLAACDGLGASIADAEQCTIHRDFYADQVIVSGSRLYLIDFDLLCLGNPALDVGNFLGHITEQSLRITGNPKTLQDREKSLEKRYVELAGEKVRPAIRSFATLTLARHIYLSTQFAERKRWTEKLLALCEERLELS